MRLPPTNETSSDSLTTQERALLSLLISQPFVERRHYQSIRERGGGHPGALKVHIFRLRAKGLIIGHERRRGYFLLESAA